MAPICDLRHLTQKDFGVPPEEQCKALQEFVRPHIESFDFLLEEGLSHAVADISPEEFLLTNGSRASIYITDCSIGWPQVAEGNVSSVVTRLYPAECRERGTTYTANLRITLEWKINDKVEGIATRVVARVPIMVKSKNCSLAKLKPAELIAHHEEAEELGGYFIVNGIEKIIRMLIMPRRNYPIAMVRSSWKNRGPLFTEYGVSLRSVKKDQTGTTNVLHYLSDGSCSLSFIHRKEQFFVPLVVILRAFIDATDYEIYSELIKGFEKDVFYKDAMANMLRTAQSEGITNQINGLKYMGERFRVKVDLPEWYSDETVARFLIRSCICLHLESDVDRFNLLIFMTKKLFTLANDKCCVESADNPMNQELLLGGHLYLIVLKERLQVWLQSIKANLIKEQTNKPNEFVFSQSSIFKASSNTANIGRQMEYLLATGNVVTKTGLGLMQTSGMSVVADKLNFMRYLSHFRCVHRGAFFAQMRTTGVRKLLPEAWGFMCPVHTPDGAPCGLLNHLSAACQVINTYPSSAQLPKLLCTMGMIPYDAPGSCNHSKSYIVVLDGKVIGRVADSMAEDVANRLRYLKVLNKERVPPSLEVALIPKTSVASQYPGLFLFTSVARMIRPVQNLRTHTVEYIGTFEQVYMDIAVTKSEMHSDTTHIELSKTTMLSAVASLTPFSDFNQSPRNMYQCQMGKQTMGFPSQALAHRSDNKLYKLQTPQTPLIRNDTYNSYAMDDFPLGTNAVVAVISYTGYDMEDAMIINKSSLERGFAHGTIVKNEFINLAGLAGETGRSSLRFGCEESDKNLALGLLDKDGLPPIGRYVQTGEPYYSYYDTMTSSYKVKIFKNMEPAYVQQIRILSNDRGDGGLNKVCITLYIQRNPIIGDKFSSRHGQKGILSQKWPAENMPFSESGITPDILFNPHGFPSRMTIGMMIESMAGKSASLHGITHDATPFKFSEDQPAINHFGDLLLKAGYNYYGNERFYSGADGRELEADIFVGVVYYQRLRHMVADKFQVRTTGPIDNVTHQPVQGRKRQGGIRFGEMERDALIAHGAAFLLQDRLLNCSDKTTAQVCKSCGSLLSPIMEKPAKETAAMSAHALQKWYCLVCKSSSSIVEIAIPYVFRYLVAELAAMNIRVTLDVQ